MIVQLNTSVSAVVAAKEDVVSPSQEGGTSTEGMSLAERETYNLALDAQNGNNVLDKVLLNLVQPPALVLFALLDTGRVSPEVPLPQAQDAYDSMAATKEVALPEMAEGVKGQPGANADSSSAVSSDAGLSVNAISLPVAAVATPATSALSTSTSSITA